MKKFEPADLVNLWKKFGSNAIGRSLFSSMVGKFIPYTGSISPKVEELGQGHCRVSMKDCRKVRNHLNSIHAIALANLGEFSTGLATISILPEGAKMILLKIETQYHHKARGTIYAIAESGAIPTNLSSENTDHIVQAKIFDEEKKHVSTVIANWVIRK